jgi:hypothetical protein
MFPGRSQEKGVGGRMLMGWFTGSQNIEILKMGFFGMLISAFLSWAVSWDFGKVHFERMGMFTLVHRRLLF